MLLACKGGDKAGGGGGGAGAGGNAGGSALPKQIAAWAKPEAAAQWEGAWVTRLSLQSSKKKSRSLIGDTAALEVRGKTATVFDGDLEVSTGFALESPCNATFSETITEGSMKGGTAKHGMIFVMDGGQLVVGSGAAGYRKDTTAVVCSEGADGGVTLVEADGTCATWRERFDKWEKKPTTCAWSQKDGADVLTIGTGDWATVVSANGEVLTSEQFRDHAKRGYHARATDFADAKAKVTAEIKKNDPVEQAKALGGVVGKTDTVVSLIATFASDQAAWTGKPVELTAQYLNSNTMTSNGVKQFNAILVDGKDTAQMTVGCELAAEGETLAQYSKVTAKGTLGDFMGKPRIKDCVLTAAQ
jgi:hypothetical protein